MYTCISYYQLISIGSVYTCLIHDITYILHAPHLSKQPPGHVPRHAFCRLTRLICLERLQELSREVTALSWLAIAASLSRAVALDSAMLRFPSGASLSADLAPCLAQADMAMHMSAQTHVSQHVLDKQATGR